MGWAALDAQGSGVFPSTSRHDGREAFGGVWWQQGRKAMPCRARNRACSSFPLFSFSSFLGQSLRDESLELELNVDPRFSSSSSQPPWQSDDEYTRRTWFDGPACQNPYGAGRPSVHPSVRPSRPPPCQFRVFPLGVEDKWLTRLSGAACRFRNSSRKEPIVDPTPRRGTRRYKAATRGDMVCCVWEKPARGRDRPR